MRSTGVHDVKLKESIKSLKRREILLTIAIATNVIAAHCYSFWERR